MSSHPDHAAKAATFRQLHQQPVFVLPNVWDVASTQAIAGAGAVAIATGSFGVNWSLGLPDGGVGSPEVALAAVGRIVASTDLPVTADVEDGYGPSPADVHRTVTTVLGCGAVGINLEDTANHDGGRFVDVGEQRERIAAARDAATDLGLDLFINARTDPFLSQIGEPSERLGLVLERAAAYAEAGADGLFVPGLLNLDVLRTITSEQPLPVNALAGVGAPPVAELAEAGVTRISMGGSLAFVAYAAAGDLARSVLETGEFPS